MLIFFIVHFCNALYQFDNHLLASKQKITCIHDCYRIPNRFIFIIPNIFTFLEKWSEFFWRFHCIHHKAWESLQRAEMLVKLIYDNASSKNSHIYILKEPSIYGHTYHHPKITQSLHQFSSHSNQANDAYTDYYAHAYIIHQEQNLSRIYPAYHSSKHEGTIWVLVKGVEM